MQKESLYRVFIPSIIFIVILWITFWIDIYFHINLWKYGLYPRTGSGLIGILTMPLIHADFQHLINNSIPLLILLTFLYQFYRKFFFKTWIFIWIASGLWTWVFARPSYHIGASALIYGLATFLFFAGIIIKEKRHIALSLIIVFIYGSLIWGIFPIDLELSWEGHLTGFIAGIVIAFFYKNDLRKEYISEVLIEDNEDDDDEDAPWKQSSMDQEKLH